MAPGRTGHAEAAERTGVPAPAIVEAPGLRFVDVVHRYGDHVALDHLTLEVSRGETLALLGPNGAGKSTTISLFLGLLRPGAGTVEVFGTSPHDAMACGRVGAMLQQGSGNGLPPGVKVATALRMVSQLYPCPVALDSLAEVAGIADLLGRPTHRLSGGQAQRVRFAMAISGSPELLFLDEPTAAMDVHARQTFWRTIRKLGEDGRTVVFATHHLDEADNASRVVVINQGRVVADGPGATLKAAVAARQLRFVVDAPDGALLDRLQGVTDVRVRGRGVTLDSLDADATVRDLVGHGVAFRDLEVAGARLEEAFMALTSLLPPAGDSPVSEGPQVCDSEPPAGGDPPLESSPRHVEPA
jgi:ABC-2 type transport system ATP-binding protein